MVHHANARTTGQSSATIYLMDARRAATETLYDDIRVRAQRIGRKIVDAERGLDLGHPGLAIIPRKPVRPPRLPSSGASQEASCLNLFGIDSIVRSNERWPVTALL